MGVGLYNNQFLKPNNLSDLFNVNAYIAVAAIGMSMIIITGNIDISVGAAIGVPGDALRVRRRRPARCRTAACRW